MYNSFSYNPYGYYQPPVMTQPQQQIPQQQQNNPQSQSVNQSGVIWVQGESGAKSYLVAPNTTVTLWDSEDEVIYLKSADANGMPTMKILDYKMRDSNTSKSSSEFVTREDFEREIRMLKRKIDKQTSLLSEDDNDE